MSNENIFSMSTRLFCLLLTCQSAKKRLSSLILPPDLVLDSGNFNIRIVSGQNGKFWIYPLAQKFRSLLQNAKHYIGMNIR